ncbi:hypothetical protein HanPI659440_Chr14g0570241 [Helianthus annuus]|nr:hypothetical protein HanPI659440_Chr14g0570241 [Helianthus annuus]
MDHMKQQYGGSLSFTERLFGPKDAPSTSSSGLFSSVFGPSSTVPLPLPTVFLLILKRKTNYY